MKTNSKARAQIRFEMEREYKDLSAETFCCLMLLKIEKSAYKSSLIAKFDHMDSPFKGDLFVYEKNNSVLKMNKKRYFDTMNLFGVLWLARRRLQKVRKDYH